MEDQVNKFSSDNVGYENSFETFVITTKRRKIGAKKAGPKERNPERQCFVCDRKFKKTYSLSRHMQLHTGTREFKCPHCSFEFIQKSDLHRHLATHSDIKGYKCNFNDCTKEFRTKRNLHSHQVNTHLNRGVYECNVCKKSFSFYNYMRLHKKKVHGNRNEPFECDYCGTKFTVKKNIRMHVVVHRRQERFMMKKYQCMIQPYREKRHATQSPHNDDENESTDDQTEIIRNIKPESNAEPAIKFESFNEFHESLRVKEEKDVDRDFLLTFLPLMNQMDSMDKNKFKRKIELIIDKVLRI